MTDYTDKVDFHFRANFASNGFWLLCNIGHVLLKQPTGQAAAEANRERPPSIIASCDKHAEAAGWAVGTTMLSECHPSTARSLLPFDICIAHPSEPFVTSAFSTCPPLERMDA